MSRDVNLSLASWLIFAPIIDPITMNPFTRYRIPFKTMHMIILQNITTTNHRKSGERKYDSKLTELDVVTTRIRYRVNGAYVFV